jgi:outer membrane autotransporter protein
LTLVPQTGGLSLATVPNTAGVSGAAAVTTAQSIAFLSSNVVFDRITELRRNEQNPDAPIAIGYAEDAYAKKMPVKANPIDPMLKQSRPEAGPTFKPAAWIKGFGDYEQRNNATFNFAFGGTAFTRDLSYNQSSGGFLVGGDLLISRFTSANDALILGVMGGYNNSNVDLRASPTTQRFNGGSFGVYSTYLNGPWFVDLMAKFDFLDLNINGPGVAQSNDVKNSLFGGNVGYKIDFAHRWYIEPTAGIEYVRTNFDQPNLTLPGAVPLADGTALRVRGGARFGTDWVENGIRIEPNFAAFAYDVVKATGGALFTGTAGGGAISLPNDEGKVRGEIQAAVNGFDLKSGLSGFVRLDARFGEDYFGIGGRAGLRYQW